MRVAYHQHMKSGRTSHVRSVLLAAIAAFCVVTFGALPHAAAGATPTPSVAGSAQSAPAVAAVAQHDSELAARVVTAPSAAQQLSLPDADLGSLGMLLAVIGLLLAWSLRRPRLGARYLLGSAPARAPPLAA
jgi:hypothetical protein